MKLLKCNVCWDVFNLVSKRIKVCSCGNSAGAYKADSLNAWYSGPCEMLGIANHSFHQALMKNSVMPPGEDDLGIKFDAFIIPEKAPTVSRSNLVKEVDKQSKAS